MLPVQGHSRAVITKDNAPPREGLSPVDAALAEQVEAAVDASRIADHSPAVGRLVAGKVENTATLAQRSAAASRNEMHTDIAAAEDVIDPRNASPRSAERDIADAARVPDYRTHGQNQYQSGHDAGYSAGFSDGMKAAKKGESTPAGSIPIRHGRPEVRRHTIAEEALPDTDARTRIHVVSIMVEVPVIASEDATQEECLALAVRHLWQQSPCVHFCSLEGACVNNAKFQGDDFPGALAGEVWAQGQAMSRAIERANDKQREADEDEDRRGGDEDRETREDSHRYFKGGVR